MRTDRRHVGAAGRSVRRFVAALAATAGPAVMLAGCGGDGDGDRAATAERRAEVAERGAEVMPFDLDATTHRFEPVDDGLVETVVADDPGDVEQVGLVRQHLAEEAERFADGDLDDPAAIHGEEMPGLDEIAAGAVAGRIVVDYRPVEGGGRITYSTDRPALVDALHHWGEAQVSDHGDHAEGS